ncbi:MAG TPA: F0F1 ATP synthase subunit A [Candidatus Butyricicoccus stercorigallinarum]|nr:F0F1 ATP synthase subunit A [Candidatus Butyricicoccus stercorigallinarum]
MDNLSITGAKIYFTIPGINYPVTQTVVNAWIAMIFIVGVCIWLTRGMKTHATTRRQAVAEMAVQMAHRLVGGSMGEGWEEFTPFIAAILSMSVVSSLMGLTGAYSPTNDLNTFVAWALVVFVLITYHKIKTNGFVGYLKGFVQPIFVMLPMNIIGELAVPVSMALRHFANILSGYVIGLLMYAALGMVSESVLSWLPGALSSIPILQVGLPAVLNVYFSVFSGCVQPYIFCMLTMQFVASAASDE